MVKHGRNRKRRAGRIGRTKLKQKGNYKRWDPNIKIKNSIIRDNWDISKSPTINLTNMGLRANVNNAPKAPPPSSLSQEGDPELRQKHNNNNNKSIIQLFDIPDSDELNNKKKRLPLNEEEQKYVVKCLKTYGKNCLDSVINKSSGTTGTATSAAQTPLNTNTDDINYKKMFRDIKINNMQYTEEKLRKMCTRYILLDPEQRF